MNWLKHAFALDDGKPAEPTDAQKSAVDRVLAEVIRRKMRVPAQMLLETCRPLNFVAAQTLHFFSPLAKIVLGVKGQDDFARFLEKRNSIDYLLERLDALQQEPQDAAEQLPQV